MGIIFLIIFIIFILFIISESSSSSGVKSLPAHKTAAQNNTNNHKKYNEKIRRSKDSLRFIDYERVDPDSPWGMKRADVFFRDDYKCVKCGRTAELTVDHIKPLSEGGSNSISNLQTLCVRCHEEKHNRKIFDKTYKPNPNYGDNKKYKVSKKTSIVKEAIAGGQILNIDYIDGKGEHTNRDITPLELTEYHGHRVIKAYCHKRRDNRTFLMVRIKKIDGEKV